MNKLKYIDHLDLLRAISVLLVIFFHLDIPFFSGGFLGVDVFFVISGFLITRLIKNEYQNNGRFSFKNFYVRRAKRLLPSLFLVIILTFIFSFLILSPDDFIDTAKSMFYSSTGLSNFYFLSQSGYFDNASHFKPLLHTWSLGIEEQFYILWPLILILLLTYFRATKQVILILTFLALSFFITIYVSINGLPENVIGFFIKDSEMSLRTDSLQFYLLPFRSYEFLIGAALSFLPVISIKSEFIKTFLNLFGLILIVFVCTTINKETLFLSSLTIIPCLGAGLLIVTPPSTLLVRLGKVRILKLIGKASYTWYLFHWPIFVLYRYVTGSHLSIIEQVFLFICSFLISLFVYKRFETPLRTSDKNQPIISNKKIAVLVISFICGFAFLNYNVSNNEGWLWRLDKDIVVPRTGAHGFDRVGLLNKSYSGEPIDMFWYGDSHASHYANAIDSLFIKKNAKVVHMTNIRSLGLPEIINYRVDQKIIDKEQAEAIERINAHPNSVLVLSYHWHMEKYCSKVLNETSQEFEHFERSIESYNFVYAKIDKFISMIGDKKAIIIGENPRLDPKELSSVNKTLRPKYFKSVSSGSFPLDPYIVEVNESIKEYFQKNSNVLFIDPTEVLCEDGKCLDFLNDTFYYKDDHHLSQTGALFVLDAYEQTILDFISH
jgi:peptidoglycan/LPS O-acetylase OafA/YrhL